MKRPTGTTLRFLSDYCSNTSLHGFNYFPGNRGVIEVVFWLAVIGFGVTTGAILISRTFQVTRQMEPRSQ